MFVNFKPMERFNIGTDVSEFRGLCDSMSKKVMNLLQPMWLRICKIVKKYKE